MMKNKPSLGITVLFVFFSFLSISAIYAGKDKPELAVKNIPEELKQDANTVYRNFDIQVIVNNEKSFDYIERKTITILSDKSHEIIQSQLFDPDLKIKTFQIDIYDAKGDHIRKVKKDEIEDVSYISDFSIYEDTRLYYVDASHSSYPITLEVTIEYQKKNFYNFPIIVFQPGTRSSILKGNYSITCPKEYEVKYRYSEGDLNFSQDQEDNKNIYVWECDKRPAHTTKTFQDQTMDLGFPFVMSVPTKFEVEGNVGSNENWEEWGKYFYNLNDGRTDISDDLRRVVQKFKSESSNTQELIDKLYKYLQENNRYVSVQLGIGGYQTYPASYVEERQYGDCKALSNFMKSMLEEADVESFLTIANLGDDKQLFYEDFPASYYFNHMILYVPEEEMFLECTSSDNPPGYVSSSNHDKNVILLTPEGGIVKKIERPSPESNLKESTTEVWLDNEGKAKIDFQSKGFYEEHELYRALTNYPTSDVKNYVQRSSNLPVFTFNNLKVEASDDEPEAELSFTVESEKFGVKAGPRMFVPLNPTSPFKSYAQADELKFKYEKRSGYTRKTKFIYHVPEGYAIESLPESKKISHDVYGYMDMVISQEDGKIIYERTLYSPPFSVTPDEYADFKKYLKKYQKADDKKFVLVANRP